ncbi:hypothetical protein Tco_1378049 [Tanacetum coccineum]
MILSGADQRPPMLDKDLYDSWKSRMELYIQNKEHKRMILESVENDPLIWPIIEENRATRTKKYAELSATKKIQADCDMKATNIIRKDTLPILLSFTHCGNKTILRVLRIILVILPEHPSETKVFHNEDGNPARANIKQALGSYERSHKGVKASANSDIMYFFTSAQDGDPLQDDVKLYLGDDLKKAQDHNQRQVKDESKDHYPKCTRYQMKNQMSMS